MTLILIVGMFYKPCIVSAAEFNQRSNQKVLLGKVKNTNIYEIIEIAKNNGIDVEITDISKVDVNELLNIINYAMSERQDLITIENKTKENYNERLDFAKYIKPMVEDGRLYERFVTKYYEDNKDINNKNYNYLLTIMIRYICYEDPLGKNIESINNIDLRISNIGLTLKTYEQRDSWVSSNNGTYSIVGGRGRITVQISGVTISWDVLFSTKFYAGEGQILFSY